LIYINTYLLPQQNPDILPRIISNFLIFLHLITVLKIGEVHHVRFVILYSVHCGIEEKNQLTINTILNT